MEKIELKVINISNSQAQASAYAMVLQEVNGDRQLPIIIGSAEAQSIALKMKDIKAPRPLTHDLFTSCLTLFDISISEILIYRAHEGVFYSYIYFKKGDSEIRIDARTSDAIALAVRFYSPIYIYESILARESITIQERQAIEEEEAEKKEKEQNTFAKESLDSLKNALNKAIAEEDYELASLLRDEIQRREQ
ncbi:bifunctional nuclease family protein [Bacteroides sp. 519]|uniref:bifunctional nuclease family protein n=1 Tax=Bacteroides sp. 519 TaxID=2302937 RepID=UPI0013CF84C1|nr:bifunctional nuclease family protein [Bacteroides sp. 519]NDV58749.1 DNA helicase UvrB [Bacteroides sp. 519]